MNKLLLLALVAIAATACTVENNPTPGNGSSSSGGSSSGGSSSGNQPGGNDGSYTGRYSGDGSGSVTMTVNGGDVDVVATVAGTQYPGSGNVAADGAVTAGVVAGSGVTVSFSGKLANGAGAGTWSASTGTKGSWTVAK